MQLRSGSSKNVPLFLLPVAWQDELDKAVKQIGRNVVGVQGDVSNLADLDRLYATVKQQGRIDVLSQTRVLLNLHH
jgi:hypothetical protein